LQHRVEQPAQAPHRFVERPAPLGLLVFVEPPEQRVETRLAELTASLGDFFAMLPKQPFGDTGKPLPPRAVTLRYVQVGERWRQRGYMM